MKNSEKSSCASNKTEGNPLTEAQANEAIESYAHKHFLKPEQEVRNFFLALKLLDEKLKKRTVFNGFAKEQSAITPFYFLSSVVSEIFSPRISLNIFCSSLSRS